MEQSVLEFWETVGHGVAPYDVVWQAVGDALARFPSDPRADQWRWKMAYYMALSGEGDEAVKFYADQITIALNQQGLEPEDLPSWFQSSEYASGYLTPPFTLQLDPVTTLGNDVSYLVSVGDLHRLDSPGESCLFLVENDNQFTAFTLYNVFPEFGFFITQRNPTSCFAKDVTDDGIPGIIIQRYNGGHVGTTFIHVFDITTMPPKEMPFGLKENQNLVIWGGWIADYPKVGGITQLQVDVPLGFCDEYGVRNYQWNGATFEISKGWIYFESSTSLDDQSLFDCSVRIEDFASELNAQDALSIFEKAYTSYFPVVETNQGILEEFRILEGIYEAYAGNLESARTEIEQVARFPYSADSDWIQPSLDFLRVYQTPGDLYRACSTVNVCVPYYREYTDRECVEVRSCDYQKALSAMVSTAFTTSNLAQLTSDLRSAGVHTSSEGW